jgi:hypothetical protein
MPKISYPRTSPYTDTPQASWYIGQYRHRTIPVGPNDTLTLIGPEFQYRPDKMAFSIYGTEALWWVFMARNLNVLRDPIWDFVAGTSIYVPTTAFLKSILGT